MEFADIVKMVMDNGLSIVIVAYFLWRDNKYNANMLETLTTLKDAVSSLSEFVKGAINK